MIKSEHDKAKIDLRYHHGDLRSALVSETAKIVAAEGRQSVTIRELAKRLGVSRNAPYRHFTDKNELLCAVAEVAFYEFANVLKEARNHSGDTALQQLYKMGIAYLEFSQANGAIYKLMFNDPLISENKTPSLQQASDATFGVLLEMLKYCQQQGVINRQSEELQAMFVWSSIHGLSSILLDTNDQKVANKQQKVASTLEMVLRGLGASI